MSHGTSSTSQSPTDLRMCAGETSAVPPAAVNINPGGSLCACPAVIKPVCSESTGKGYENSCLGRCANDAGPFIDGVCQVDPAPITPGPACICPAVIDPVCSESTGKGYQNSCRGRCANDAGPFIDPPCQVDPAPITPGPTCICPAVIDPVCSESTGKGYQLSLIHI